MSVVVFGSLNHDTSLWLPHFPSPDETLPVVRIEEFCGGKGANQATAAARLGAEVAMIGCVGDDPFGRTLTDQLVVNGVNVDHVRIVEGTTGRAFPIIADGEVIILIAAGANAVTGVADADAAADTIAAADVLLLQGEVGADGARRAAELAKAAGTLVVFNPAPVVADVAAAVLPFADIVTPNRAELEQIDVPDGVRLVVTLGPEGALIDGATAIPSFPTDVIDPTGAGDSFCGALAVGLADGLSLEDAARRGCAAGALACRRAGAEPSMPTKDELEALLAGEGPST